MATVKRTLLTGLPSESNRLKRTLYVGGLDDHVNKAILQAAFIPFGDIRTTEIPIDRATGKHRGFGFIEFEEEKDADQAIDNMNEAELYGRILRVNLAKTPARRPGEGSKAVWSDDSFLRQQLAEESLPITEEDMDLAALLKCTEAQEALRKREDDRRLEQAQIYETPPDD
ncbi:peptidyl-prolyl cis-trans isomerase E-like [Condylostylus longicornis]|uniref:peptidyl-prolyl cis-trans isomerase E-like n=1 Tax=Condylostylus longicornis TaxID=2530218 RepID=UPI00244DF91D|nr:peptidyl-prolyl cis-trans isomerase E-like [Condylostylus longicornis]